MKSQWRLFRHDAGRVAGPPAWVYVALFVACLAVGYINTRTFGSVVLWPANGVLLAAVLQLPRRQAIGVLAVCLALNLGGNVIRGDSPLAVVVNAGMNTIEVLVAALLARRFCGAAMDMRRPTRLARFAFLAATPAALLVAVTGLVLVRPGPELAVAAFAMWFSIELLGLWLVTPALMMMATARRFAHLHKAPLWERITWPAILALVTAAVFAQSGAPVLFLIFPAILVVSFRLSPSAVGLGVIIVAVIAGAATLMGQGPILNTVVGDSIFFPTQLPPILRIMPVYYLFMVSVMCVALPVSTGLTERRRLELRLKARARAAVQARLRAEDAAADAADAAQARSRFLAMMSHEMRTPLNGVAGYAAILSARPDLPAEARRQVDLIRSSSDGLLRIVDDILDFSRGVVDLDVQPFSIAAVVDEIMARGRGSAEAKGLSLRLVEPVGAEIRHAGDARRIGQVLSHLLGNAIKFSDRGAISVAVVVEAKGLALFVSDQGRGLGEADPAVLFEPFAQGDASISRNHSGAGMGLAVCRRMVDAMGGEIGATEAPGGGALFWFRVPAERLEDADVAAPAVSPDPSTAPAALDAGRAPHVLVVDDHPVNREVAGLMLTAAGCDITYACDGAEAVEAARARGFDLILMDVRMPRMDGLAATRAIRALEPRGVRTPITAMTADAMPEDVARCLAAGMDEHLAKPVNQQVLVAAVERALAQGRGLAAPVDETSEAVQAA